MAKALPSPANGSIVLHGSKCDFAGFSYDEVQATESVAAYGAALYDPHRASGMPHASLSCTGYSTYGATGLTPGFAGDPNATGTAAVMTSAAGGTGTVTIDTGVTIAGPWVTSRISLGHARTRAAVPLSFQLEAAGDMVVTWPVA